MEKDASHEDSTKWRLQSLFFLSNVWEFYHQEKIEESQEIARDAAIAFERHMSPLRGKGWVIHNWELVRTCVGILRVSIGMCFGVFL